jgi:hypothetical protein
VLSHKFISSQSINDLVAKHFAISATSFDEGYVVELGVLVEARMTVEGDTDVVVVVVVIEAIHLPERVSHFP